MIFVVSGAPRHGKNTFGDCLAKTRTVSGRRSSMGDTSSVIYESLAEKLNCTVEELRKIPKNELRPQLVDEGNLICDEDPNGIVNVLLDQGHNVIVGVRRVHEYLLMPRPNTLVWVEREGYRIIKDNTEYDLRDYANFDFTFPEDGFEEMKRRATQMVEMMKV